MYVPIMLNESYVFSGLLSILYDGFEILLALAEVIFVPVKGAV